MKGESNQKRSNGTGCDIKISNSRAMGVIVLIALLFVFQVVTFVWHKVQDARLADGDAAESAGGAPAGGSSAGGAGAGGAIRFGGASGTDATNAVGASAGGTRAVRNVAASGAVVGGRFARGERFVFDPNTISADSLQLLGFSAKQAQSILKYRAKGGKFRYREDFSRLYVVDSAVYAALEGYIALPHRGSGTKGVQDVPGGTVVGTKGASGVPGAVQNGAAGTKGVQDAPGGTVVGTKEGISVPGVVQNGVAGTKGAQNVPGGAVAGTNKGVFVPDRGKNGVSGSTDSSGRRESIYGKKVERNRYMCNLNTADSAALVQLYGIGGYFARKILRYREMLGGSFVDARQLLEIEDFTQERFAKIEKNVFVRSDDVKGFSILKAERKALERHPYIGPYAARGIVTYLKLKGRGAFGSEIELLEQLVREKIISEGNAHKLREYLLHL